MKLSWSKTWVPEVIADVLVLASCAVLVALFAKYNGQPPPEWYLSIPALATFPTRLVENLLSKILQTVINQLSVLRFLVPRPLRELDIYNKAARSVEGAPGLIYVARLNLASFAAIVAITRPWITTTAQVAFSQRTELVPVGTRPVPICQRLSTPPTDPGSLYQGVSDETIRAMFNGVMATDSVMLSVKAECAGADTCVWHNYSTIALDYQCQDMTSSITRLCANGSTTNCTFTLPSTQLTLQSYEQRYISQAYLPAPFLNYTPFALAAFQMMGLPRSLDNATVLAAQCVVYPVVNTYVAQFFSGEFTETLLSTWYNDTGPQPILPVTPEWLMTPGGTVNGTFSISQNNSAIPLQNKDLEFFTGSGNVSYNGIYYDQDQHQRLHSSLLDGTISQTIGNFALALSTAIRLSTPSDSLYDSPDAPETQALGQAFRYEQRIRIRWAWLTPLAVAAILTTFVLLVTIYQSMKAKSGSVFKGNILAIFNMAPADRSNKAMYKATGSIDHQKAGNQKFVIRGKERRRFRIVGRQVRAKGPFRSGPRTRRA
ncbi:hypothetical protein IMSHALPRED_010366 [Imshaugia aleurites]|uniref:Uncharacterized protein n=1 Tax=Imshaugia aleurites TaxID=172621 RepID=A0A8H3IVW7_9LECA|nr:hypothetical protein IMSHALPRED_010366 [Imshaugia aleurites]